MRAGRLRTIFSFGLIGMLALFVLLTGRGSAQAPVSVELKAVKYGELTEAVRAQKGKVLVVDVWADFCIPCKQEFPNLVRLHKTYAEKGLVCFSVTVDPPTKAGVKQRAEAFLVKQQATFPNFLLDEPEEVWQNRWDMNGPPAVFVFDRQGKRAAKFQVTGDKAFTYAEVEAVVKELLERKP